MSQLKTKTTKHSTYHNTKIVEWYGILKQTPKSKVQCQDTLHQISYMMLTNQYQGLRHVLPDLGTCQDKNIHYIAACMLAHMDDDNNNNNPNHTKKEQTAIDTVSPWGDAYLWKQTPWFDRWKTIRLVFPKRYKQQLSILIGGTKYIRFYFGRS